MLFFAPKPFTRHVAAFPKNAKVNVYCRNTDLPAINVGNGFIVTCTVNDFKKTLARCQGVDGISVSYKATKADFDQIARQFDVQVISQFYDGNLVAVCGRSNKIVGGVVVDKALVNIQLAFDGATLTVGYPLILDSY